MLEKEPGWRIIPKSHTILTMSSAPRILAILVLVVASTIAFSLLHKLLAYASILLAPMALISPEFADYHANNEYYARIFLWVFFLIYAGLCLVKLHEVKHVLTLFFLNLLCLGLHVTTPKLLSWYSQMKITSAFQTAETVVWGTVGSENQHTLENLEERMDFARMFEFSQTIPISNCTCEGEVVFKLQFNDGSRCEMRVHHGSHLSEGCFLFGLSQLNPDSQLKIKQIYSRDAIVRYNSLDHRLVVPGLWEQFLTSYKSFFGFGKKKSAKKPETK